MSFDNKITILHIFDDEKITKHTINLFNQINGFDQEYAIISNNPRKAEINYEGMPNILILNQKVNVEKKIHDLIQSYDIIFLQALSYIKAKVLAKYKFDNKIFVWGLWGYDLYNYIAYKTKTESTKKGFFARVQDYYTFNVIYKKAFKKINYCLFLLEQDYKLLKSHAQTNAKWISNCYQTIEQITEYSPSFRVAGKSILAGNSSTRTNRHEIIFNKISGVNGRRIICPLNYGDLNYQSETVKVGREMFGNDFHPLVEFLELKEYLNLLKECSVTVMAHERQQAFGTILQMLFGGSKVFLSEQSPLYRYFLKNGFVIYSIEQHLNIEALDPLPCNIAEMNKNKAIELYSESKILEIQKTLLEKIQGDCHE
ncbi:MAG: TDP-N-acetylfucosamine:lipid II N-acetylfucosaminyltransferase [Bacteroidales bacterium]|nr:TDP-N-acetylfucosamine:lipid II N-acetylfucosaminyltransferase [Bacteroidales bacterium]